MLRPNLDNTVTVDELKDSTTGSFINSGATLTMSIYRDIPGEATMAAGSTTLTTTNAQFASGDATKAIIVEGAGNQGADLRTTISSFVSATEVTLAAAATNAVSVARFSISLPSAKDVSLTYVTASDGKYRGTFDKAVPLKHRMKYRLAITIDGGTNRDDYREFLVQSELRARA